ncbi:MAG: DUF6102 family protein [Clostridia bacterium]|nr:DUF6102 family protein [Clostridia bacterium]
MEKLLTDLITSIIGGVDSTIDSAFNGLMDLCFNAEYTLTHNFGIQMLNFDNLKTVIFSMALSLIILKFLKKGFDIYILWTEGESDTPPLTFVTYFIRAIVTLVCFTTLYDWLIEIAKDFGNNMLTAMNLTNQLPITQTIASFAGYGIFSALLAIIALILLFVLYVQFIIRGFEMFILKMGFPLACVGLVEANGGVFKSYSEKLFKSVLTVLIQIVICKIAIALVLSVQFLYAIAAIIMAIKTPKFLQEFTLGGGTGGISNVIITASKTMELSGQLKRKIQEFKKAG